MRSAVIDCPVDQLEDLSAESLGISRKTLFNKMRQYGLLGDETDDALP